MKILITGATGYIGRRLVYEFLEDGADIRLLVRNAQKLERPLTKSCEIYEGNTFDKDSLKNALDGVHTAYYLIHSMGKAADYEASDRLSAENFRDACIEAGVKKIIYLGGLGSLETASKHLRSRIDTGDTLAAKPDMIDTVIFRAGVIIGSGSASFEIIRNICQKLPAMITPKWVDTLTEPIGIDDVLHYLKAAGLRSFRPEAGTVTIDIGAGKMSFKEMILSAADVMGLKRFIIKTTVLSPRFSAYWLMAFTPVNFGVASALIEGLASETVRLNSKAEDLFPDIVPEDYETSIRKAIDDIHHKQVLSRWCDSSGGKECDLPFVHDISVAVYKDRYVHDLNGYSPDAVFRSIMTIGGEKGWFGYDFLWQIRGFIDKIAGGYGLSRGRRISDELRVGDSLDFWKVADIVQDKRLLLSAQMKLPGRAWLEFQIVDDYLIQTAYFYPHGLFGRLYWYSMLPFHVLIFRNMTKKIVEGAKDFTQ